jgi:hypothetical protein
VKYPLLLRVGITLLVVGAVLFLSAFVVAIGTGFRLPIVWAVPGLACLTIALLCVFTQMLREVWS